MATTPLMPNGGAGDTGVAIPDELLNALGVSQMPTRQAPQAQPPVYTPGGVQMPSQGFGGAPASPSSSPDYEALYRLALANEPAREQAIEAFRPSLARTLTSGLIGSGAGLAGVLQHYAGLQPSASLQQLGPMYEMAPEQRQQALYQNALKTTGMLSGMQGEQDKAALAQQDAQALNMLRAAQAHKAMEPPPPTNLSEAEAAQMQKELAAGKPLADIEKELHPALAAMRLQHVYGMLDGQLKAAAFEPTTGQYVDPFTLQPLPGFKPMPSYAMTPQETTTQQLIEGPGGTYQLVPKQTVRQPLAPGQKPGAAPAPVDTGVF
ncbi:MAG: hypothetical protein KGI66_02100, partial [Patescibacteria group bacterium]|nr:hypothetical protein [Patescibacteria group bacterium]